MIVLTCLLYVLALPLTLMANPISLWRVNHCDATVYVLGSIHAVKPSFYPLPLAFDSAFNAADRVIFEVELQRINDVAIRTLISDRGLYPSGQQLDNKLSAATLQQLREYLLTRAESDTKARSLTFSAVKQMRPWYLSLMLGMRELQAAGYESELGIDRHYYDRAQRQQKPIGALETAEAQVLLLATDSPEGQDLALRSTLQGANNLKMQLEQMIDAWQLGDVDAMLDLSLAADGDDPLLDQQFKRLINDRNLQMLQHIRGYLGLTETTLVVVGALHLGGEQGLLRLLRADYRVTQIDTDSGIAGQPIAVDTKNQPCR